MNSLTATQIRLLRLSRGMGQKDVADKMKITVQRYSQLENHKKGLLPATQEKILKALGYTLEMAINYLNSIPPPRKFRKG